MVIATIATRVGISPGNVPMLVGRVPAGIPAAFATRAIESGILPGSAPKPAKEEEVAWEEDSVVDRRSAINATDSVTTPESVRAEVGTNVTDVGKVVTLPGIARCPTPANEAPRAPPWNATDAGRLVTSLVTALISYTRDEGLD